MKDDSPQINLLDAKRAIGRSIRNVEDFREFFPSVAVIYLKEQQCLGRAHHRAITRLRFDLSLERNLESVATLTHHPEPAFAAAYADALTQERPRFPPLPLPDDRGISGAKVKKVLLQQTLSNTAEKFHPRAAFCQMFGGPLWMRKVPLRTQRTPCVSCPRVYGTTAYM